MIEHRGIKLPSTADDWELYTSLDGADEAADQITTAAKKAVDIIAESQLADLQNSQAEALRHIHRACEDNVKLGACDSEPMYHARHVVIDAIQVIGGIEVDPWSL